MRLLLNPSLQPIDRWQHRSSWNNPEQAFDGFTQKMAGKVEPGRKLTLVHPKQPEQTSQSNIVLFLADAYNYHWDIALAPHDLWYLVLTQVAQWINADSARYRHLFTREEGKPLIAVPATDNKYYLPVDLIINELKTFVPGNHMDSFLPEFSTHTADSRVACMAAFCDAVQSYYSYGTYMCGIRSIDLLGTLQDWRLFGNSLAELSSLLRYGQNWFDEMRAVVHTIEDILEFNLQRGGEEFFRDIFTKKNVGSGSQIKISGWISKFIHAREFHENPLAENVPQAWSKVPWKILETNEELISIYGCFFQHVVEEIRHPAYGCFTFHVGEARDPNKFEIRQIVIEPRERNVKGTFTIETVDYSQWIPTEENDRGFFYAPYKPFLESQDDD